MAYLGRNALEHSSGGTVRRGAITKTGNALAPIGARALRALVLTTMAEREAALAERERLQAEHDALLARNERLHHQLLKLQRAQFRRKLASSRLFADETVVPVLDPGRGRTRQGYFWTELVKVTP